MDYMTTHSSTTPTVHEDLRSVDRELLDVMRSGESFGIGDLTEHLGVTATAIRLRVERMLELGLLEREKVVAGRGRPTFQYRLTVAGHRRAGANPVELAEAMWQTILSVEDHELRARMLADVASRLGQQMGQKVSGELSNADSEESLQFENRMKKLSEMFTERHIRSGVSHAGDLPVLDFGSCPYPTLTDTSEDRAMCRLEEQMISEALGRPVHLSSCRLDGDSCCQFAATESVAQK